MSCMAIKQTVEQPVNKMEVINHGPQWSCEDFGKISHDYFTCPKCQGNYQQWLSNIGVRQ